MNTEKTINEAEGNAVLPLVVRNAFLNVKEAKIQFSNACKKYIESKPHQDMIKALKRAGAF